MKLRANLLIANGISISFVILILFIAFRYMLVTKDQLLWLGAATLGAGVLSAGLHFLLVRPLEASVRGLSDGAARIADGELRARVAAAGPTEFKALAEQFNAMAASLERSFGQIKAAEQAQRELVANIAHDLRTPLASLQSYAEALEDGVVQDDASFRRYIATIRSETIRLGELIQDVFDLSLLENGESRAADEPAERVVVEDLLVELLPRFSPSLSAKQLQLRVQAPERALSARMPAVHLSRVLQNLIENAIRHSPRGGIIAVEAERMPGRRIRIAVSDEGAGIPERERRRVFERFYRLDRSRSREGGGSGLGLSIAKLLVERRGGEIGVEPAAGGQGSRFWFTVEEADSIMLRRDEE